MAQDGSDKAVIPLPHKEKEMPASIAKAILVAIKEAQSALPNAQGERGMATFRYASINDVISACHEALIKAGLAVTPIEAEYSEEPLEDGKRWARYGYKFRLVHEGGSTWIDDADVRHLSIVISEDGLTAGKAQSLALRDYFKGLLRIRTQEPEEQPSHPERNEKVPRETNGHGEETPIPIGGREKGKPVTRLMFSFRPGFTDLYTIEDADKEFQRSVANQRYAIRRQWESSEVNCTGLRQLKEADSGVWFRWRKQLDSGGDGDDSQQATSRGRGRN